MHWNTLTKYTLLLVCSLLIHCSGGSGGSSVLAPPTNPTGEQQPNDNRPGTDFASSSENQQFSSGSSGFYSSDQYKVYGNSTFISGGPISSEHYQVQSSKFNTGQLGIQLQIGADQ